MHETMMNNANTPPAAADPDATHQITTTSAKPHAWIGVSQTSGGRLLLHRCDPLIGRLGSQLL